MLILLTGANGFLGSALLDQLKKTSHSVLSLVRKKKSTNEIECDVGNASKLLNALNEYKPDAIINCAASVDFTEESIQEQYRVNALAPAILASWCVSYHAHLIQTSGSIVNGNRDTKFDNDSIELPINNYGETKLLADRAIRLSQCSHTIVRFGGIFGEGGPDHLGINNVIKQAKSGKIPTIIGKGSALRNYIHVQDAADLLIYCLDNKIIGTHYSGNHQIISIEQMIKDICSVYLNDVSPYYKDGLEGVDQLTKVSSSFPDTTSFRTALKNYR